MPGDILTAPEHTASSNGHSKKRYLLDRPVPPQEQEEEPSYYDLPMLKPPIWTPEVTAYFFLGGVSAGSYVLARLAERIGGESFRDLTRTGTALSLASLVPCAPLLIIDLGDPKRFHHMFRVFKPSSPMNLGSWALMAYSGTVGLAALREWARSHADKVQKGKAAGPVRILQRADGTIALAIDGFGIPLALLLATYTGVLLTGSSVPIWSKNPYLPPLFTASAMSTGAAAVNLALAAKNSPSQDLPAPEKQNREATDQALVKISTTAHVAEEVALSAYLKYAGKLARPLTQGPLAPFLWGGVVGVGLALPEILAHIPAPPKAKRWLRIASSVATLAGGALLRYAIMQAGHHSTNDPQANREATRARKTDPDTEETRAVITQ